MRESFIMTETREPEKENVKIVEKGPDFYIMKKALESIVGHIAHTHNPDYGVIRKMALIGLSKDDFS